MFTTSEQDYCKKNLCYLSRRFHRPVLESDEQLRSFLCYSIHISDAELSVASIGCMIIVSSPLFRKRLYTLRKGKRLRWAFLSGLALIFAECPVRTADLELSSASVSTMSKYSLHNLCLDGVFERGHRTICERLVTFRHLWKLRPKKEDLQQE